MKYIFLDESGELGFKKTSTKFFIITLLSCEEGEVYSLRRIMRKVRSKIIKKKMKRFPELKGNNSTDKIRKGVLNRFVKTNSEIFVIILDKSKVSEYLKEKKNKLYDYISNLILNECSLDGSNISLIVDKSKTNRSLREDFDNYIRKNILGRKNDCILKIKHENSQKDECLQVLDFISWAIFRNYEYNDPEFMNIIKDKIVIKKEVFEKLSGP